MELAKEKRANFLYRLFRRKGIFLRFVFHFNVLCIEYTFRIYILLHIKKHYFIHFCCLFLKLSKAFSVYLILTASLTRVPFFLVRTHFGLFSNLGFFLSRTNFILGPYFQNIFSCINIFSVANNIFYLL